MNIGIFTDTYEPQINGVVTSVKMLQRELQNRGHNVYIFTASNPQASEDEKNIFRFPAVRAPFVPAYRMSMFLPPQQIPKLLHLKLDVVHTQTEFTMGWLGKLMAESLNIPMIHTYHTMYADYTHYILGGRIIKPGMAGGFSRVFCNRAQYVVAPVEKTRRSLLDYGVSRPIRVIPTGIDFKPFAQATNAPDTVDDVREELGIPHDEPVILFVGRVAQEKSIDVIIKAMPRVLEEIPGARFVVVGDGPALSRLKTLRDQMNLSKAVVFAGSRPWNEIGKYYRFGDLFVTASTSETQGLTWLEAMAAEVPVVAKSDPSLNGVIADGVNGFLFQSDEDAGSCIIKALSDRKRLQQIALNAQAGIQHFSADAFARTIEQLYQEALDAHPGRRRDVAVPDVLQKFSRYPRQIGKIVRHPRRVARIVMYRRRRKKKTRGQ